MARKSKKVTEDTPVSVASRFKDSDGFTDPKIRHRNQKSEQLEKKKQDYYEALPQSTNAFGDDPYAQPFPLNYVYATQDYLNDHMDSRKLLQLLAMLFVGQSVYLNFYDKVWLHLDKIIMNYSGVLVGTFFTYNMQWKKHIDNNILPKPLVPEFNLLYAVLIPNLLSVIYDDKHIYDNLCFNYFAIENSPLLIKAVSSIAFYILYGDTNNLQPFLSKIFVMVCLNYGFDYINHGDEEHVVSDEVINQDVDFDLVEQKEGKVKTGFNTSLSKAEIQIILVALSNIIFFLKTEDTNIIIFQKLVIGLIGGFVFSFPIIQLNKVAAVPVFGGVFYYVTNYLLEPILQQNSLKYVVELIQQPQNINFFYTWVSVLSVGILVIFNINFEFNLRRKLWHFIILATILPSYIKNESFTELGLLGLLVVLLIVESIRLNRITFIGEFIHDKLYKFQDFKDLKGPLNLSYIYLLIGVTTPMMLQKLLYPEGKNIKSFIGLVTLGVGDSFASIIGKKFGKIKYPGGNKTVEGTAAFILGNYATFKLLEHYLSLDPVDWEVLLVTNIIMGIFEGIVTINDNLIIPVLTYIVWVVLENGVTR